MKKNVLISNCFIALFAVACTTNVSDVEEKPFQEKSEEKDLSKIQLEGSWVEFGLVNEDGKLTMLGQNQLGTIINFYGDKKYVRFCYDYADIGNYFITEDSVNIYLKTEEIQSYEYHINRDTLKMQNLSNDRVSIFKRIRDTVIGQFCREKVGL